MTRALTNHARSSLTATLGLVLLLGGLSSEYANAQIEETRLTQPKIEPIPERDEAADQEEPTAEPPEDRAAILGMTIEAASRGRAVVTDVAVNSPAEGAGVKKGDHLLAINGLEIGDYEEWLDGVRRIIRDTPDGANVQVTVERRGRRANIPIKTLIAAASAPSQGANQAGQSTQPIGPGLVPQMPAEGSAGSSLPGTDIFAANQNFFGAAESRPNERAIAHLYLLAGAVQALTPEAQSQQVDPRKDAAVTLSASAADERESSAGGFGAKGRIGIAGFRNRDQGMLVMVDVGMVPPGNYMVGIADPSTLTGGQLSPGQSPSGQPGQESGNLTTPRVGPQQGAPGAGNTQRPATIETPRQQRLQEPLRQVLDTPQPIAPPGPQGEGAPVTSNPNAAEQLADPVAPRAIDAASAPGMSIPIGQLTVDQSGTGRMQDLVEGLEVGAVVGQAVVLYAMPSDPGVSIPPGGEVVDSANAEGTAGAEASQQSQPSASGPMPVAAGLIEIVDARGIEGQSPRGADQGGKGSRQPGAAQGGQLQPSTAPGRGQAAQPGIALPPPRD